MLFIAISFISIASIALAFGAFALLSTGTKQSRATVGVTYEDCETETVADTTDQVLRRYAQRAANK